MTTTSYLLDDPHKVFGVNMHPSYPAYSGQLPQLVAIVQQIGFGIIRSNDPLGAGKLRKAGWTGEVLTAVNSADSAQVAADDGSDYIDPVNEITMNTDTTKPPTLDQQKQIVADINTRVGARIPLIGTSIALINGTRADALGYQPWALRANVHTYRGNAPVASWQAKQAEFTRQAGKAASGKAAWVTETGTHDYLVPGKTPTYVGPENNNHQMTPPDVAAAQVPGNYDYFLAHGVERLIEYELKDQWKYQTPDGIADHEGYFGILRDDLTLKPKALAIQAYISAFVAAHANNAALQQQVVALQTTNDNLSHQITSLNTTNATLGSQLADANSRRQTLKNAWTNL